MKIFTLVNESQTWSKEYLMVFIQLPNVIKLGKPQIFRSGQQKSNMTKCIIQFLCYLEGNLVNKSQT